nr:hypothetical protein [Tanacetum cinerariifolium]
MPQPMQNPKDSLKPITEINTTLALLVKAFKVNAIPTNKNQRSSLIPRNSQIAQLGMNTSQDIRRKMVDDNVRNQYGNGNIVTAPTEGNGNGVNGNPIRCYNCQGEGHYASNGTVKPRKRDVIYLQQQLQISQEEEIRIQSTQEEFEFMAAAYAYEKTKRVKVNCTSEDTLQQASTSRTQSDNAPVYDSDGSTEKLKDENMSLEYQVLNYAKENAHLKTTYKNLFDSIKVTQAQTNSIIDSLQKQLYDTIYDNAKLRAQLFVKVSEQKGISKDSRVNNFVPNKHVKASVRTKPITVSQPHVITKNDVNSKTNGFSHKDVKSTTRTRRPQPRNNPKNDKNANVSNQKKHKAYVWKPKNVGSKERLASPKPSKPRACLRWSPTGILFDLKGKIIASSESESQSNCSNGDNTCTSNHQEPINKRFPSSNFSMTGCQNWLDTLLVPLLSEYKSKDKEHHGDNESDT